MFLDAVMPGLTEHPTAVEVSVWEGYLLRSKINIGKTLCTYSLDNGPLNESGDGNLTFRFTRYDWEKNIVDLLVRNNIHYAVLSQTRIAAFPDLLKKKIFIAEDDPDVLLLLKTMFEDAGYQVRVSSCGSPVVQGNFSWVDLFLLDRVMPDMDGVDICRYLRAQASTRHTPVVLISAMPDGARDALNAGADDYILKPFEMHYLLNVVSKFVKGKP